MKLTTLICLSLCTAACLGQGIIPYHIADESSTATGSIIIINGMAVSKGKYLRHVDATPFFYDRWMKGEIAQQDGRSFGNLRVRLNLLENILDSIGPKGEEMTFSQPLRYLSMTDSMGGKYDFVYTDQAPGGSAGKDAWLQVLVNDKVSECMQSKRTLVEGSPYGYSTIEQTIKTTENCSIEKVTRLPASVNGMIGMSCWPIEKIWWGSI